MRRSEHLLLGFFAALMIVLALLSDGTYHKDDLSHFLIARDAWASPRLFLDAWGRPGFTIPYAFVAWIGAPETGLLACRLLSVALTVATAWFTLATARRIGMDRPILAAAALLAMPLYVRLGCTTLTETIAAFYLALGTWLVVTGRHRSAAAVVALLPLARHEAIVLLPLFAFVFLRERRVAALLLLGSALAVWNVAGFLVGGAWPAAVYFQDSHAKVATYGEGSATFYLLRWIQACGFAVVLFSFTGLIVLWRSERPLRRLVPIGIVLYVALETVLYWRNTHASGGYDRFLLPVAPWMAISAAVAFEAALAARDRARIASLSRAALLISAACLLATVVDRDLIHRLLAAAGSTADVARFETQIGIARWILAAIVVAIAASALLASPRFAACIVLVLLLIQALHFAATVRPHRLSPLALSIRHAVVTASAATRPDDRLFGWSVFTDWFTRIETPAHRYVDLRRHPLTEWRDAPSGSALIWDVDSDVPLETIRGARDRTIVADPIGVALLHRDAAASSGR